MKCKDKKVHRQMNNEPEPVNECKSLHCLNKEMMNELMNWWMNKSNNKGIRLNEWKKKKWINERINKRTNWWMIERKNEWKNEWIK